MSEQDTIDALTYGPEFIEQVEQVLLACDQFTNTEAFNQSLLKNSDRLYIEVYGHTIINRVLAIPVAVGQMHIKNNILLKYSLMTKFNSYEWITI